MNQSEQKQKAFRGFHLILLSILSGGLILSSVLYAAGIFPSIDTPPGQDTNGTFSIRLANISHTCPTDKFIKGFDAAYNPICVHYSTPNTSSPNATGATFSPAPTGEMSGGRFGTYFNNLLNICSGNGILKGFTAQGKKICVSATDRTTLTDSPTDTALGTSSIVGAATPSGEPTGGKFQTFFNKMFSAPCGTEQGVTGIQSDGTLACSPIPAPACIVTSCSASAPACGTTTYGTDNCGNTCSKVGVLCGGGEGGGGGVTCPAGSINGVLSPDQSPGIANSCDFTWQSGTWDPVSGGSSLVAFGTSNGTANGTCNKYGNWDYFFNCPNKAPGALNCVGGGRTIDSPDGSNVCQFYFPNILDGQSASITSDTGTPGGWANGSCGGGTWTYSYSCPNKVTPVCSGQGTFLTCPNDGSVSYYSWGGASLGGSAEAWGSPSGYIAGSCVSYDGGVTATWQLTSFSCP